MVMAPDRLYVPAFRNTTCPLGQAAIALLICAAVAPGFSVAQMVVRLGMPPGMPAWLQSVARDWSMIPDHSCAWEYVGRYRQIAATTHATNKSRQRLLKSERFLENIVASPCFGPKTTMFPWSYESPPLRQPGYQAHDLIQGFAPPPRSGFAFIGKGFSAMHAPRVMGVCKMLGEGWLKAGKGWLRAGKTAGQRSAQSA